MLYWCEHSYACTNFYIDKSDGVQNGVNFNWTLIDH